MSHRVLVQNMLINEIQSIEKNEKKAQKKIRKQEAKKNREKRK